MDIPCSISGDCHERKKSPFPDHSTLTTLYKAGFFFCEASFLEDDIDQARRTGHLTAQTCGEIATTADVKQLVPFHFSRRYETRPEDVYLELSAACSRIVMPTKSQ